MTRRRPWTPTSGALRARERGTAGRRSRSCLPVACGGKRAYGCFSAWRMTGLQAPAAALILVGGGPKLRPRPPGHASPGRPAGGGPQLLRGLGRCGLPSIRTRTFREPWGMVVNEAMHNGPPVIATDARRSRRRRPPPRRAQRARRARGRRPRPGGGDPPPSPTARPSASVSERRHAPTWGATRTLRGPRPCRARWPTPPAPGQGRVDSVDFSHRPGKALPHRSMRRAFAALTVLGCLLVVPATAGASGRSVVRDCTDNGRIDSHHSQGDYKSALGQPSERRRRVHGLPPDHRAGQAPRRELQLELRRLRRVRDWRRLQRRRRWWHQRRFRLGDPAPSSNFPASPAETSALAQAGAQGGGPVAVAGEPITPGGTGITEAAFRHDVPGPLLALVILLGLGALAMTVSGGRARGCALPAAPSASSTVSSPPGLSRRASPLRRATSPGPT